MNKTIKWILIGLAIAVGVFLIALPVFYLARHAGSLVEIGRGMMPYRSGALPHFRQMPFMHMFPIMGIFGFFRLLLPLAVLGLAVYGVVALVRGRRTTIVPPSVPTAAVVPPVPPAARVCTACGRELHKEGEFCPFCGAKQ